MSLKKLMGVALASAVALSLASSALADAPFELRSDGGKVGMSTFNIVGTAYAAYATPTDMVGICGSATRTVFVTHMWMGMQSTSAALQTITYVRRSTADTGGTLGTNPTVSAYDSLDAGLNTAVPVFYTAAPTVGTSAGNVRIAPVLSGVLTATPAYVGLAQAPYNAVTATNFSRPEVLRGTGDCLYMNYGGGALTSGFAASWGIEWEEFGPN